MNTNKPRTLVQILYDPRGNYESSYLPEIVNDSNKNEIYVDSIQKITDINNIDVMNSKPVVKYIFIDKNYKRIHSPDERYIIIPKEGYMLRIMCVQPYLLSEPIITYAVDINSITDYDEFTQSGLGEVSKIKKFTPVEDFNIFTHLDLHNFFRDELQSSI